MNKRIDVWIQTLSPPGFDAKAEKRVFILANALAFAASFLKFLIGYLKAREALYFVEAGFRKPYTDVLLAPFSSFSGLDKVYLKGLAFFALYAFAMILAHYGYYRQDCMSIYLMKRLPDRFELHKRAIAMPLIYCLLSILLAVLYILFYFAIYVIATPDRYLHPYLWQDLMEGIFLCLK